MTDALTNTTTYFYDALNRLTNTTFPDNSTQVTAYDADGRKVSQTDQASKITQFFYDGLGRLIAVTNSLNQGTTYAYDEVGNQTNQIDALNHQTTFAYDALGRRTKRTLPAGQSETFSYDAAGNTISHTDFNGLVITNNYDSMNRLLGKWHTATNLEAYEYDAAGQLTNRTDTSGVYTWVLDTQGRATTNTTPVGTLHYGYDANGNQTSLVSTTTGGVNLQYQYDAFNRLTNVLDANLGLPITNTAYTYDAVGNLRTLAYPNGVTNLWQYDSLNRLTNLVSKHGLTLQGSFYYKLGPTGIRTNLAETVSSTSRSYAWSYDSIYRLTSETISTTAPMGTINYVYDAVGNRTNRSSSITGITNQTPTFNSNDWLTADTYDSNGNTTDSASITYGYDYANRLTNYNSGAVTLVYDADGNRIQKTKGTTNTLYLVSAVNPTGYPQVVEEFTVSGTTNLGKVYTFGLSLISQRVPTTSTNFFGYDGHGSTRFLTDVGGNIANVFAYDAYGNLIASNSTPQTAYLYSGEQIDADLGFYYLRARYYKTDTGRFWTMDTDEGSQEDPLSLHKYLYCEGNPVDGRDASGHDLDSLPDISSSLLGAITFNILFAEAGGSSQTTTAASKVVRVLIVVDTANMPPEFDAHKVQEQLQAQISAKVFSNLASGGSVQIRIVTGNMRPSAGWQGKGKTEYLNVVHWSKVVGGSYANSNWKGETWIDMDNINPAFAGSAYSVNNQFFANLLAHEVFWLNAGHNHDQDSIPGGEISSGNPTYKNSEFDVSKESRKTLVKEFGFESR